MARFDHFIGEAGLIDAPLRVDVSPGQTKQPQPIFSKIDQIFLQQLDLPLIDN